MEKDNPLVEKLLNDAKEEAFKRRNKYAGTEHILLALLKCESTILKKLFKSLEVDYKNIVYIIDNILFYSITDEPPTLKEIKFTPKVEKVFKYAKQICDRLGSDKLTPVHIFLGLLYDNQGSAISILKSEGIFYKNVKQIVCTELDGELLPNEPEETAIEDDIFDDKGDAEIQTINEDLEKILEEFGENLNEKEISQNVVGGEEYITRMVEILCRKNKSNVILVGEPGVGKTTQVYNLVNVIKSNNVPDFLKGKKVFSLDLNAVIAGTKYRGEFEERLQTIIYCLLNRDDLIVYIDEIHQLTNMGKNSGTDMSNVLKSILTNENIRFIGSTTFFDYKQSFEQDRALERRFQKLIIKEPDASETYTILKGVKEEYENYYQCKITDGILKRIVKLSDRFVTQRKFPDKAIDILDEVGSFCYRRKNLIPKVFTERQEAILNIMQKKEEFLLKNNFDKALKLKEKEEIQVETLNKRFEEWKNKNKTKNSIKTLDVDKVVSKLTNIPINKMKSNDNFFEELSKNLFKNIFGQDHALKKVINHVKKAKLDLQDPDKPLGSFLLAGSTGVGKTHLVKTLHNFLYGRKETFIRFDMSEFSEAHSVAKFIGAPPGYIGYENGGVLTEFIKNNPYSIVLFDEIEKAHPQVYTILLQLLDAGRLTDTAGETVNFRNCYFFATTNIGVTSKNNIGFGESSNEENFLKEIEAYFKPEFLNRFDEVIVFNSLEKNNVIDNIIAKEILTIINRITEKTSLQNISLDGEVVKFIKQRSNVDKYGAREIKRSIEKLIFNPLISFITETKKIKQVKVSINENKEIFFLEL